MNRWETFISALDWISRVQTVIKLLLALGLGDMLKLALASHIPQPWLLPFWLFSSAAILAFIVWLTPKIFTPTKKQSEKQNAVAELPGTGTDLQRWCESLAYSDKENINQRVIAVAWEPRRVNERNSHYIEFKITFVNASIFELKSPRLGGIVHFDRHPLPFPPQFSQSHMEGARFCICHSGNDLLSPVTGLLLYM